MGNNEKMINAEKIDLFNSPDFVDCCMVDIENGDIDAFSSSRVILAVDKINNVLHNCPELTSAKHFRGTFSICGKCRSLCKS